MPKKSADIKVRVDALTKSALVQIAQNETLDLSDVVRHALKDYVRKKADKPEEPERTYAHA